MTRVRGWEPKGGITSRTNPKREPKKRAMVVCSGPEAGLPKKSGKRFGNLSPKGAVPKVSPFENCRMT